MTESQIVKWGTSLAVRVPKHLAQKVGMREGDPIVIEAAEGLITVRPDLVCTLFLFMAPATPENRYDEIRTDRQ